MWFFYNQPPAWSCLGGAAPARLQLGGRLTVGHTALDRRIGVRIPASQPTPRSHSMSSASLSSFDEGVSPHELLFSKR